MADSPILLCYDGSHEADRAIIAAAALFPARRAIVLDVGPVLTETESVAALSPVLPGQAFEDENLDEAQRNAGVGAGYPDAEYERAGAKLADSHKTIFEKADLVIKVKEPLASDAGVEG